MTDPADPFDLQRFVDAQARVYDQVRAELGGGAKRSHWMWFVFPQIAGLGSSPTSVHYAISSLDEAKAYLAHPTLGARLKECAALVNAVDGKTARQILGTVDAQKFRSSMTLFSCATPTDELFARSLAKYFDGEPDPDTLSRL